MTNRIIAPSMSSRVTRRKERTRRLLLRVALELFFEKGIYVTTIEDITERADVGKGTFYKYFKSKDALLETELQEGLDHILTETKQRIDLSDSALDTVVGHIIGARLDFFLECPQFLLLFHQIRGLLQLTTESSAGLRTVYNAHLDQLAALLRKPLGRKHQMSRPLAIAIAAYTSGLLTYHLLFSEASTSRSYRDDLKAQLEGSIQAIVSARQGPRPAAKRAGSRGIGKVTHDLPLSNGRLPTF